MKRLAFAALLLAATLSAGAQQYYDIDVDLPAYPDMQPVPDSPVYYAPAVDSNYFFYDGLYWDYSNDGWYASTWYNGPWEFVDPIYVPTYLLWVPIRFYHRPPPFFRGWNRAGPPRWGEHWGQAWQAQHNAHSGTRVDPAARAPLPSYQRQYPRAAYPRGPQQYALHAQQYAYHPQTPAARQHYESRGIGDHGGAPRR
jgi:hypothetical protein